MSHLDDGLIQELVDGEVPSRDLPPIQAHLASCVSCRARLDAARGMAGEVDGLLELLDGEGSITAGGTATAGGPAGTGTRRGRSFRPSTIAWAASLMIAVGLGYAGRDLIDGRPAQRVIGEGDAGVVPTAVPVSEPVIVSDEMAVPESPPPMVERRAASRQAESQASPRDGERQAVARSMAGETAAAAAPRPAPPPSDSFRGTLPVDRMERMVSVLPATPARRTAAAEVESAPAAASRRTPAAAMMQRGAAADEMKRTAAGRTVDLVEAMALLGGRIRLIDGMVPERLEAAGDTVAVVYRSGYGELRLVQLLERGEVSWSLHAPALFPADSLAGLRARVRE